VLKQFRRALRGDEPGGPGRLARKWRESVLTLTYPDSGDPAADAEAIYAAWPRFIRRVRLHLVNRGSNPRVANALPFLRVLECAGNEGGHAHLHVWLVAPFIHHSILRSAWGRSLDEAAQSALVAAGAVRQTSDLLGCSVDEALAMPEKSLTWQQRDALDAARARHDGRPLPTVLWPVVDIRKVTGDPANELIKYLVKDITKDGLIDSLAFSRIFVALEGRRVTIASRKLWVTVEPSVCPSCDAVGAIVAEPVDKGATKESDQCRAPPAVAA